MGEGLDGSHRILAVCCEWSGSRALAEAGNERQNLPPGVRNLDLHCAANLDPLMVLQALWEGVGGILVFGCPSAAGHFRGCAEIAQRRVFLLKTLLQTAGVDPSRIRYVGVRPSEGKKFAELTRDFSASIESMGPFQGVGDRR